MAWSPDQELVVFMTGLEFLSTINTTPKKIHKKPGNVMHVIY